MGVGAPVPATAGTGMVGRAIEEMAAAVTRSIGDEKAADDAQSRAIFNAQQMGNHAGLGMHVVEFEINDYPEIARKRITAREPLDAIHELTGARCLVKGQYFKENAKMPEGARKLYVELSGPTDISVSKGHKEVRRMMEALAIRTLNIAGLTRAQIGMPGRYDPAVGM